MKSAFLILLIGLVGCVNNEPDNEKIKSLLDKRLDVKGCATSAVFKKLPIDSVVAKNNKDVLGVFEKIGMLNFVDTSYVLTSFGEKYYDESYGGFCYSSGYEANNISVIDIENDLPAGVDGAWTVSFVAVPVGFESWAVDKELIEKSSLTSNKKPGDSKSYEIRIIKKSGSDFLEISDPNFNFNVGMNFNVGW